MIYKIFYFLFCCSSVCYCFAQEKNDTLALQRLNNEQRIEYIKKGITFGPATVFKDSSGNIWSRQLFLKRKDKNKLFPEYFVDSIGNIKEIWFRSKKTSDDFFIEEANKAATEYRKAIQNWEFYQLPPIDCNNFESVLELLFDRDQKYRKNQYLNAGKLWDLENQNILFNLFSYCDSLQLENVSEKAIHGFWLVIQHSDLSTLKKYYPLILHLVEIQRLSKNTLKLTEDRIAFLSGKSQKYNTQYKVNPYTGKEYNVK